MASAMIAASVARSLHRDPFPWVGVGREDPSLGTQVGQLRSWRANAHMSSPRWDSWRRCRSPSRRVAIAFRGSTASACRKACSPRPASRSSRKRGRSGSARRPRRCVPQDRQGHRDRVLWITRSSRARGVARVGGQLRATRVDARPPGRLASLDRLDVGSEACARGLAIGVGEKVGVRLVGVGDKGLAREIKRVRVLEPLVAVARRLGQMPRTYSTTAWSPRSIAFFSPRL